MPTFTKLITLQVELAYDFGEGWDYSVATQYPYYHQWAGSHDRSEDRNHAEDALWKILHDNRISEAEVCHMDEWFITVELKRESDLAWFKAAITQLELDFKPRDQAIRERHIEDQHSNTIVTWYSEDEDPEGEHTEPKTITDLILEWPCLARCYDL